VGVLRATPKAAYRKLAPPKKPSKTPKPYQG
jgi:hypothetical protein